MDFEKLLARAYRRMRMTGMSMDAQALQGWLYDQCGNDFELREKADQFRQVNQRINLFGEILDCGGDISQTLYRYGEVADILSVPEYEELVELVGHIVETDGASSSAGGSSASGGSARAHSSNPQAVTSAGVAAGVPQHQGAGNNSSPQNTGHSVFDEDRNALRTIDWGACAIVEGFAVGAVALITGILALLIFVWHLFPWTIGQHIVGVIGGIVFVIALELNFSGVTDQGKSFIILLSVALVQVANTVLIFALKDNYSTIFYWITIALVGVLVIWSIYSLVKRNQSIGWVLCCVTLGLLVLTVLAIYLGLRALGF